MITQGLGPEMLGDPNSGSRVDFPYETYVSPSIDLTQVASNIEIIPARPGHIPFVNIRNWLIESHAGTLVTPPTTKAGNDAAHTNVFSSSSTTPTAADVNGAVVPSIGGGPTFALNAAQRMPNATVYLDVTSPASGTGGFALTARLVMQVFWMAPTNSF